MTSRKDIGKESTMPIHDLDTWFEIVERGTRGDQVYYEILYSWKHDRDNLESVNAELLKVCKVALDALGCDRLRQDRLEAQRIIKTAVARAESQ